MFHRVTQQNQDSSQPTEKIQNSETARSGKEAGKMGGEKPQEQSAISRPKVAENPSSPEMPKRAPSAMNKNQPHSSSQQKETKTMNADNTDNKSIPQGGYQPTPAQSRMDIPGARPAAAPRAASAPAYPGSAPASASAYSPTPAANGDEGQKKLQIGKGITLSGEIEDCEYLFVEGTVEAALKGASTLEIAESGAFYGTVEIEDARIAGRFEGDLTAKGRLTIEATGSITGSIAYKELAVEAGATVEGKIMPLDSKGEARVPEGNFAKGKAKRAANAAQADNELPFSDKAAAGAA